MYYSADLSSNYEIDQEIYGKLTRTEVETLVTILDNASRAMIRARNVHGKFVWNTDNGVFDGAVLAGQAQAWLNLMP